MYTPLMSHGNLRKCKLPYDGAADRYMSRVTVTCVSVCCAYCSYSTHFTCTALWRVCLCCAYCSYRAHFTCTALWRWYMSYWSNLLLSSGFFHFRILMEYYSSVAPLIRSFLKDRCLRKRKSSIKLDAGQSMKKYYFSALHVIQYTSSDPEKFRQPFF